MRRFKIQPKFIFGRLTRRPVTVPQIVLAGKWLQQCGFKEYEHVVVEVRPGELLIRLAGDKEG